MLRRSLSDGGSLYDGESLSDGRSLSDSGCLKAALQHGESQGRPVLFEKLWL